MGSQTEFCCPHDELIRAHAECQSGMFLNGTYTDNTWFGGFSQAVSDMFWNFVTPRSVPSGQSDQESMERFFAQVDRKPVLYGETAFIDDVAESLEISEVETVYSDQWMEFSADTTATEWDTGTIKEVREGASIGDFTEVFIAAFGDSDDESPHRGSPITYIQALDAGLRMPKLGDFDAHVVVYDDEDAVAVGSIIGVGRTAILYNMGTVPDRQGEGIGSQVVETLTEKALQRGFERVLLQAEPGGYVEDFYAKNGFERVFQARGITGDGWEERFDMS